MSTGKRADTTKLSRTKRGGQLSRVTSSRLYLTLQPLFPSAVAILFSELLLRFTAENQSFLVIIILGAVLYTALRFGQKWGLIGALIMYLYYYYLLVMLTGAPWFALETLQRSMIIAIAFPVLAFIIGRLKERNDNLLLREQSARHEAEASERQLRFMAEAMPQKIFTIKPNGDPDYANPQWQEYMGGTAQIDATIDWGEVVHPDDAAENMRLWRHSLKTGKPFQFEHRLKRTDGQYIWHLTRAHALRDDEGRIITWVGSSTDIEDVRRTRQLEADTARLTKQRAELMELNAAKDEFISIASHQLRTPATGVKQYVGMALDGYGGNLNAKVRAFLEKANESNNRQLSVINDLLQVAQVDAGKVRLQKEPIDASELIQGVIQEQSDKFAKRNQTVHFKKPRAKIFVAADGIKLRMVIENIIDNASKYTPRDKSITIRLSHNKNEANIAIKDEGVGIAQMDKEKVFQKFVRLENPMSTEVGGTGLGLYWVRKIIDLHGGSVEIMSKRDKGTTFTISLPLSDAK